MSKIPLDEMTFETEFPSNVYSVEIYSELSPADFEKLFQKFRYYCKKADCSFLLCLSTTESKTAKRQRVIKQPASVADLKKLFWEHLWRGIVIRRLLNLTAQLGNVAWQLKNHLTASIRNRLLE